MYMDKREHSKAHDITSLLAYDLTFLSTEAINFIYILFVFKMKNVEIQINGNHTSPEQILVQIKKMNYRVKIASIVYWLMFSSFIASQLVFGLLWANNVYPEQLIKIDKFIGILNIFTIVPMVFFKLYLGWYFYRVGLKFIDILGSI